MTSHLDFQNCLEAMEAYPEFGSWLPTLPKDIDNTLRQLKHGELEKWQHAVAMLPQQDGDIDYELSDCIRIGKAASEQQETLAVEKALKQLCPWRKGPFNFFGVHVDTEWRSDWKWQRIHKHIDKLTDKTVLDVGCGSGYHLWRMREAGAAFVLGIDPSLLFWQQFSCCKKYLQDEPVHYLPLRSEDLPERLSAFDTVFSMGVLYHRRSPLDHLVELRNALKPGGQLVLETLIIDIPGQNVLFPKDRYAMMRNVFFLPSIQLLSDWLARCGFVDIELVDTNQTSVEEQRVSDWVKAKSLKDFLDPHNMNLTVEGYPAPLRASLVARKDTKFQ